VIKRAGTLDIAKLIQTWEGAKFSAVWGDAEMRAYDHQLQSPGFVSEILELEQIPAEISYYGNDFPYIGRASGFQRKADSSGKGHGKFALRPAYLTCATNVGN
jgi:hypothetical protein